MHRIFYLPNCNGCTLSRICQRNDWNVKPYDARSLPTSQRCRQAQNFDSWWLHPEFGTNTTKRLIQWHYLHYNLLSVCVSSSVLTLEELQLGVAKKRQRSARRNKESNPKRQKARSNFNVVHVNSNHLLIFFFLKS